MCIPENILGMGCITMMIVADYTTPISSGIHGIAERGARLLLLSAILATPAAIAYLALPALGVSVLVTDVVVTILGIIPSIIAIAGMAFASIGNFFISCGCY